MRCFDARGIPLVLIVVFMAAMLVSAAPIYHDRSNLLTLRDDHGSSRPVRSRRDWSRRREHILANMQKVMGDLPGEEKRVPLDVHVEGEVKVGSYLRRKLSYASTPGERVPAYLLIPVRRQGKLPAVLALHQTVAIAKEEPVGMGGSPDLHYGSELAERGYVVLAPDYPTMGEHKIDIYARGWASGSMKAIWDNMRGVDLLQSLPEVDPGRIGCLGHSLGGHNSLFTAAFETRIKAVVSNCGFTAFGKYYGGNISGWTGERYMPRIKSTFPTPDRMPFDFHEVVAAIAPRAFLACAPEHDSNFEVSGVREVMAAAAPVYRLLGEPERLEAVYPDCAHQWPPAIREKAYAWLDRWLRMKQ